MKLTIIYGIIVLSLFFLGMVLDVLGLWLSIILAEQKKIRKSKMSYKLMIFGEIIETIGREGLIFIPIVFAIEVLRII